MNPAHNTNGRADILSTWEIRSQLEVRIEQLFLGPFVHFLVPYVGSRHETSLCHQDKQNEKPESSSVQKRPSGTCSCTSHGNILGFRVVGRISTGKRAICDPVFSELAHLDFGNSPGEVCSTSSSSDNSSNARAVRSTSSANRPYVISFSSVLSFPLTISDLSSTSQLELSLFCVDIGFFFGHINLTLFGSNGILRQGRCLLPFNVYPSPELLPPPRHVTTCCGPECTQLDDEYSRDIGSNKEEEDYDKEEKVAKSSGHKDSKNLDQRETGESILQLFLSPRSDRHHRRLHRHRRPPRRNYAVQTPGYKCRRRYVPGVNECDGNIKYRRSLTVVNDSSDSLASCSVNCQDDADTYSESDGVLVSGTSVPSWSSSESSSANDTCDSIAQDDCSADEEERLEHSETQSNDTFVVVRPGWKLGGQRKRQQSTGGRAPTKQCRTFYRDSGWVRVRTMGSLRRASCRAVNCYKLLDLFERGALPSCPSSDARSRDHVQRLCEKYIRISLDRFGFLAICLPSFPAPVLYSLQPHASSFTLSQGRQWKRSMGDTNPLTSSIQFRQEVLLDCCHLYRDTRFGWAWRNQVVNAAKAVVLQNEKTETSLNIPLETQDALQSASCSGGRSVSAPLLAPFHAEMFPHDISAANNVPQPSPLALFTRQRQTTTTVTTTTALTVASASVPQNVPMAYKATESSGGQPTTATLSTFWDAGMFPHFFDCPSAAERHLHEQQRRMLVWDMHRDKKPGDNPLLVTSQRHAEQHEIALPFSNTNVQRQEEQQSQQVYAGEGDLCQPTLNEIQVALAIVSRPTTTPLSVHNKQLLWKNRELLRTRGVGLLKLAASADMTLPPSRLEQALEELLASWPKPSVEGALGLLSPLSSIPSVRQFAIDSLKSAKDSQLSRFLPQLVQAVRYDSAGPQSALLGLLIDRAARSALIASKLHWGLLCESEDSEDGHLFIRGHQRLIDVLSNPTAPPASRRAWRVIELQKKLVRQLRYISAQVRDRRDRAERKTQRLRALLSMTGGRSGKSNTDHASPGDDMNLLDLEIPVPLPIEPHYILLGIIPEESFVVRSSQYPLVLACRVLVPPSEECLDKPTTSDDHGNSDSKNTVTSSSSSCSSSEDDRLAFWGMPKEQVLQLGFKEMVQKYLFKAGDDLRQDQLVTQFVGIINDLLISYGCDYCLTVYHVVSLSRNDGLIEFIDRSGSLSSVKRTHPTLRQYFASFYPSPESPLGFPTHVLDRFIRSCSAFSVITFLLGVGDRHLDNLMVSEDGRLFHVDFGFILGEDPKPFPPPMKLCSEIIDALGGLGSQGYTEFQLRCCQCFRCLRRHSNLFIDMLLLMANSGIRSLRADPFAVISRVQEKFQLDTTEAEAEAYLLDIVGISANALFPAVVDKFHEWTVYWK